MFNKEVNRNYHLYHIPGCSHVHTIKRNAIFIGENETIRHGLLKSLSAIMIKKYGDVFVDDKIIEHIKEIEKLILDKKLAKEPHEILTEAASNLEPNRRIDLIDLNTNVWYEFENKKTELKSQRKDGGQTYTVYI